MIHYWSQNLTWILDPRTRLINSHINQYERFPRKCIIGKRVAARELYTKNIIPITYASLNQNKITYKTVTPYLNWKPRGHYLQRRTLGLMPSKTANTMDLTSNKSPTKVPHKREHFYKFFNSMVQGKQIKIGTESKHQMSKLPLKVTIQPFWFYNMK